MATKTFSSRADEAGLAYADALAREQFGMSFGQYCGSVLIDAVMQGAELPKASGESARMKKANAFAKIKSIAQLPHDEAIGRLSDEEVEELIGRRYE